MNGITNDDIDVSVDTFMNCIIPMVKHFGVEGCSVKILKRGFKPLGGGQVKLVSTFTKFLKAVNLTDFGLYNRIRGVAYASKVSISMINRVVNKCREVLNDYIPDVWVYSDFYKGDKAGLSPGVS